MNISLRFITKKKKNDPGRSPIFDNVFITMIIGDKCQIFILRQMQLSCLIYFKKQTLSDKGINER